MQRLQFETSPLYLIICLAVGIGYAAILYRRKHNWTITANWFLFSCRALVVFFIALLLLGPIIKFTNNKLEKPTIVFLMDNSLSIKEVLDSTKLKKLEDQILSTKSEIEKAGYEVLLNNFSGKEGNFNNGNALTSDITSIIKKVSGDFEGKNLAQLVLVSDGVYNAGVSPLYIPFNFPINTVGIGDSSKHKDVILKNLVYNKIVYQGNKYPLRAEILLQDLFNKELSVSVFQGGNKITTLKQVATKPLLEIDFLLPATEKGLQRVDVVIEPIDGETNLKNNRLTAFIEVVEGKKNILFVAPAPHPDIKALRSVIEKNDNYEVNVYIPNVTKVNERYLQPSSNDLVIFHQAFDKQNLTGGLINKLTKGNSGVLYVFGEQSNLFQLKSSEFPIKFENLTQRDEVTPSLNAQYRDFTFSEAVSHITKYPPVSAPFGKFIYPSNASILLYERIGSVVTDRPLALTFDNKGIRTGVLIADGFWQWRLNEYSETEKTEAFDEIFSKLIQYLSTREEKMRFKSFPVINEFAETDPVIFESQVYNELFEPIYGHSIQLNITDQQGKASTYNYIINKDATRYKIGNLKEGIYKYKATTLINNKKEELRGEFLVTAQAIETQNLTADFRLLQKLAVNTGGKFYSSNNIPTLAKDINATKAHSIIHSEDTFNPIINLKWFFFLLVALVSIEWFLRKYLGSY